MARSSRLCGCFSVALVSRVVAGAIGVHVSDLAVWLSGRGPLGDWANSMLPAWCGVRVAPHTTFCVHV